MNEPTSPTPPMTSRPRRQSSRPSQRRQPAPPHDLAKTLKTMQAAEEPKPRSRGVSGSFGSFMTGAF